MKEDIEKIIENEMQNINSSNIDNNEIDDINELIENENKKQQKELEKRKKIFDIFNKLDKMGIKLEYSDTMTTKELEKILERVQI